MFPDRLLTSGIEEVATIRISSDDGSDSKQDLSSHCAERFKELASALATEAPSARYILAELNDLLTTASAADFTASVAVRPSRLPGDYLANYLAAMVETAAHHKGIRPPDWTASISPLSKPVFASELLSLRLHLLLTTPPAFRRRNLYVDASIGDRV